MRQFFRRLWWQLRMDPFVGPLLTGWAVFALTVSQAGAGWLYAVLLLWGLLWAFLERMAPKGYPKRRIRLLTPNFFAVRDLSGCWRIFQRRSKGSLDCRQLMKDLLQDQRRLPEALTPGIYQTLTHATILARLERMDNVVILSSLPAYTATLEDTISRAAGRSCRRCSEPCPFPGRQKPRQFYNVRFLIKE